MPRIGGESAPRSIREWCGSGGAQDLSVTRRKHRNASDSRPGSVPTRSGLRYIDGDRSVLLAGGDRLMHVQGTDVAPRWWS
jgi:hypothetical protein